MKKTILFSILSVVMFFGARAQMLITPATNMTALVNNFILTGVTASNIAYTGAPSAIGSFTGGNSTNLGMDNGIVLTTGSIDSVPTINDTASKFSNTFNSSGGDMLLTSISSGPTFDAAVLEFDLIPAGNILEFQYVFASEEYPEFAGSSFNDIFGFFISGADPGGGTYTNENIALIPGTGSIVCINNINATTNQAYYVDNTAGTSIIFDGFTTVLLAQATVIPGNTYHLKMAIADIADGMFDSGIFLKAHSMKSYMYVGVDENPVQHFSITPNPVGSNAKINLSMQQAGKVKLSISDISGKVVYSKQESFTSAGSQQIDLSEFSQSPSGIYLLRIETDDFVGMQKIVK